MSARGLKSSFAALALTLAAAPAAAADGLPVPVDQTFGEGVVSEDGSSRFVTIGAGSETVVMRISTGDGEVEDYRVDRGNFTVPAIAVDGTASGISADGGTLALIKPRQTFPRDSTDFLIFRSSNTEKVLRNPESIRLDGDFSFDALSPDGETMYVIEYTNPRDYDSYQVRSMDLATGELDPEPIVDPEEEPDDMRGLPQTRATSADGRWEYTLYDGGGSHPFIHALDVVDGVTVCIDLEMIGAGKTYGAVLAMNEDGDIELTDRRGELRAIVDGETLEATEPGKGAEPVEETKDELNEGSSLPMGAIAGGAALLGLSGIVLLRRRE